MKCDEMRRHWHVFYDSEGDAELHLQINEHLELCSDCSRWFFEQSRLEDRITEKLKEKMVPTAALWNVVKNQLAPTEPLKSQNWLLFSSVVFVLAASLLIGLALWPQQSRSNIPDLAQLSVALHDKLGTEREDVQFISTSHVDVEDYLRGQVNFPVRCPPREDAGFEVRGGGTCRLSGDLVAYVVGHVDGKDVSLFILSRDSLPNFPQEYKLLSERAIYHCRSENTGVVMTEFDRNLVLVVGEAELNLLKRVLQAYGSYSDADRLDNRRHDST